MFGTLPAAPVDERDADDPLVPIAEPLPPGRPAWPLGPSGVLGRSARQRPRPSRPVLPSAPALFPWLERRLSPGEATLWLGEPGMLRGMLEWVYAGHASVRGRLSLLEGANRFDPYRVGEKARALGAEPAAALERIRLARAFTAYQLVALVDAWSQEARRTRATLLIAHDLPALFRGDEVPETEKGPLLAHVAAELRTLAERARAPLLVTLEGGLSGFPRLAEDGPRFADLVKFSRNGPALRLESYRDAERLALVPRAPLQRGLEEFAPPTDEEEVMAWDGPSRRTARRSRSG